MTSARADLQTLIARATGGREPNPKRHLKASLLYHVLSDPYWVWCSYHAPPNRTLDEEGEYDRARMQRGIEFEERWVREHYPDAKRVEPAWGYEALVNTLKLMLEGARVIYQPQLWLVPASVYGKGDILIRVDHHESDFGDYAYMPIEVKRSPQVKEYQALQAAAYHWIVSMLQRTTLDKFGIALPSGLVDVPFSEYEQPLRDAIETWRKLRSNELQPEPRGHDKTASPWRVWANEVLRERMDLTLLPDVGSATRETIRSRLGAKSIVDLYGIGMDDLISAMGETAGRSIYFSALAYRLNKPVVHPGGRVSVPRGARTFAMDFETSDELAPAAAQPPHAYLVGLWDYQSGRFVRFLARGPQEEAKMWKSLLDYVGDPRNGACVHTWTAYEMGVLNDAGERHPDLRQELAALSAACVDLKEALKSQVYLAVPTWSLKSVAPAVGFKWRHDGYGAFDSMAAYWRFAQGAPESVMRRALDYHEDDVMAMVHVARALDGLTG